MLSALCLNSYGCVWLCREDVDGTVGQSEASAADPRGFTRGRAKSSRTRRRRLGCPGGHRPGGGFSGILEGECSAGTHSKHLAPHLIKVRCKDMISPERGLPAHLCTMAKL